MLKRDFTSKPKQQKKGQSTVEYIILVAAVLAVLIIFLRPGGPFSNTFNSALNNSTGSMAVMGTRLNASRPVAP